MNSKPNVICLEHISTGMRTMLYNRLSNCFNVMFFDEITQGEEMLPLADAIIVFTKGISKHYIQKATKCRIIQKLGAGYDNIDIQQARNQGIIVAVTKGVNARSVAEHAVLLMLAVYKRLPTAHNGILNGKWLKTELRDFSYELSGKQVGLIGFGSIGKEVRKLLSGFDVRVCYYDKYRLSSKDEEFFNVKFLPLDELLKQSDIISLHVALSDETHHLINQKSLSLVKETAILINTCRGEVVDEEALYLSLSNGKLLGAGLDVFEVEPPNSGSKLFKLENVVLTPHIGGGTMDAMKRVADRASENIIRTLMGSGPHDEDIIKF